MARTRARLKSSRLCFQGPPLYIGLKSTPSHTRFRSAGLTGPGQNAFGHVRWAVLPAAVLCVVLAPRVAWGDGIFDGISGYVESQYSFTSTKTTDASGNTTKTEFNNFVNTGNMALNYNLLPTLNLNTGVTYQSNISDPAGDTPGPQSELTRLRPYVWLTLRDTTYNTALGYSLQEQSVKTSGSPVITLNQESYDYNLNWNPTDLPSLQLRYSKTNTYDNARATRNVEQDFFFVKPEYRYGGLDVYYQGTYVNTNDNLRNFESTSWSNQGRFYYSGNFLDGRISVTTDDRLAYTEVNTTAAGQGQVSLPVSPFAGLSALDDTPLNGALAPNPALIDGNLTVSAGVNIGLPPLGGNTERRNLGLDFLVPLRINSLFVWVDRTLPQDIANSFSWEIYTSTDNLNWTFFTAVPVALFGPFQTRFEINFPAVQARYIKVVTRPLAASVPGASGFPDIFITELQAFLNTSAQAVQGKITQTFQNYNLDVKTIILRSPLLYYDFNGYYFQLDPSGQRRYNISNGLFLNHQFNPVLSASANAAVEFGTEGDQDRRAFLYYASLLAIPLRTLSNTLVLSGNNQTVGGLTTFANSVILYNTAQLYKGIDLNLNLGWVFNSQEESTGGTIKRTETYINTGLNISPNANTNLSFYYLGKKSHVSGGNQGLTFDTLENRLDIGASWTPFRTLFLSAAVNIVFQTGRETSIQQTYGANWAPFPDGQLQFNFYFNQSYFPESSMTIQPSLRWYLSARRRSWLDVGYQLSNFEAGGQTIESNTFSTTLKVYF